MKSNKGNKKQKADLLNKIVAGAIDPKELIYRPYTKYIGYGYDEASCYRYNDTGEVVPQHIVERDLSEWRDKKGVGFIKSISIGPEED